MAKSSNSIFKSNSEKWWKNDLLGKIVSIGTIFGFGVATGIFINSNDHKVELMLAKQEYNEKLHEEINKYRDCKIDDQEKKITEIYNTVKILKDLNGNAKTK